jgi:hypothetical protein
MAVGSNLCDVDALSDLIFHSLYPFYCTYDASGYGSSDISFFAGLLWIIACNPSPLFMMLLYLITNSAILSNLYR